MKSIHHTVVAFALACLSGAASATMVQVDFAVDLQFKLITSTLEGTTTSVVDRSPLPASFTTSFRFDLSNPSERVVAPYPADDFSNAATYFGNSTSSFAATPFTASLKIPAPAGVVVLEGAQAGYQLRHLGRPEYPGELLQVAKNAIFDTYTAWQAEGLDGVGTVTGQRYSRTINLGTEAGGVLSSDQFTELSGEDALAFLQTRVGVVHDQGFREVSWYYVRGSSFPPLRGENIEYFGDVRITSVSIVPEPEGLALVLAGISAVALGLRGKRSRTRRAA